MTILKEDITIGVAGDIEKFLGTARLVMGLSFVVLLVSLAVIGWW